MIWTENVKYILGKKGSQLSLEQSLRQKKLSKASNKQFLGVNWNKISKSALRNKEYAQNPCKMILLSHR